MVVILFQTGDVLVVRCTDVGWSPYFPLIAGLITEIGGLISHGAVVAREYGIPCIVSLADATVKIPNGIFLFLYFIDLQKIEIKLAAVVRSYPCVYHILLS